MVEKQQKNIILSSNVARGGVVILPLEEYKRFMAWEIEREDIDKIVEEGLKEEKEGKTESLESFLKREYPALYEKKWGQLCFSVFFNSIYKEVV